MPFPTVGACCSLGGSHACGLPGRTCLGNVTNVGFSSTPMCTKEFFADQSLFSSQGGGDKVYVAKTRISTINNSSKTKEIEYTCDWSISQSKTYALVSQKTNPLPPSLCDVIYWRPLSNVCLFRISLLSMTFMKYVDMNLCCFIPGRVVDEIFRVLRLIKHEQNPPRAYEILQVRNKYYVVCCCKL